MRDRRSFISAPAGPLLLVLALVLGLVACGGPPEGEPAGDELVVYSGRNKNLVGELFDQFAQSNDVKVFIRYGDTAELAAQLLEEGDRSKADVFFAQDAGALGAISKEQRFAPVPDSVLDQVDERFRAADGTWIGVSGRARVIAFDPAQVPEASVPASVLDLTDPRWKGKVGFAPTNASFQAFVTAMRVILGEDRTRVWLQEMEANGIQSYDNNILVLEAVDRGEVALGLINHYYWYEEVAEEGLDQVNARIKFIGGGDPGALVNVSGVGVLKSSDKPDAAHRFARFLLSDQAQRYLAKQTDEYPLVDGIPTVEGLPPLDSLGAPRIDLSELDSLQQTLAMIEEVGLT